MTPEASKAAELAKGVTVVIPTHNRCDGCLRAIESVLSQDPPPGEVLVCDDASEDETRATIEELAGRDPRVRYLRGEPSAGRAGPPRNLGIRAARGEWVALLDDDDRWLPGKLAAQLPYIASGRFDVIGTDARTASAGRYVGPLGGDRSPSAKAIARANPMVVSSAVVRRSLLLVAGGFTTTIHADYDMWLTLAARSARFVVIDQPLVEYDDAGLERMSARLLEMQLSLARLKWRHWSRRRRNVALLRSALLETYVVLPMAAQRLEARPFKQRRPSERSP